MGNQSPNRGRVVTAYIKRAQRTYTVRCHKVYDADIIGFLEQQPNVSGYVKSLLREKAAQAGFPRPERPASAMAGE